jgi:hypothetical protein
MKILRLSLSIAIIMNVLGCSSSSDVNDYHHMESLYGNWNCKLAVEDKEIKVQIDVDVNYVRNGHSNAFGTMTIQAPELPELEYSIATSSNWEFKNGYLIETTNELKIVNVSHPEIDDVFNLESLFPQNISESSEILVLNDSMLTLKSEMDGSVYSCSRLVRKI